MSITAAYRGEEITVVFTAETERCDYGVPGSPVWEEVNHDTIQIESVEILGVDVDLKSLPEALQKAIDALSDEVDWEE